MPVSDPVDPLPDRVASARRAKGKIVAERCRAVGLPYPPRELFLRGFKAEGQLEVWGRETAAKFTKIATYSVLASSGEPGPKRREGDRQVPEGFYEIDLWNPQSNFHLSLRINYPNAADRRLSDPSQPGSDIYIHGNRVTVGCLPLGDETIEELYLLTLDTRDRGQARIPIHLFPARMSGPSWRRFLEQRGTPALVAFWNQLQPGFDAFERDHLPPAVSVADDGEYRVQRAPAARAQL
jgi:murein L,D-transpeptidase YafK